MPITILDYVKAKTGDKDTYSASDFCANGVEMLGGCEHCGASLGAYNAYPAKSGYWRCADCIGTSGYATVTEFESAGDDDTGDTGGPDDQWIGCPACDAIEDVQETGDGTFECGTCGAVWTV